MLILVGASASGKTELARKLISSNRFIKNVTYTTRKPRQNEIAGKDYHFLTKKEFLILVKKNFFIETTIYQNNYYGSVKNSIPYSVCILEPSGVKVFKEEFGNKCFIIYLKCSEDERKRRMTGRGDEIHDINQRLQKDRSLFSDDLEKEVDFILDSTSISLEECQNIIISKYEDWLRRIKHE